MSVVRPDHWIEAAIEAATHGGAKTALDKFTYNERMELWIRNGGRKSAAPMAAAISTAENVSGDPNATHRNDDGTIDTGLWQINSVHGIANLKDPDTNAKAAIRISNNGRNWRPWTTFKSGAYKKELKGGSFNAIDPNAPIIGPVVKAAADAEDKIADKTGLPQVAHFLGKMDVVFDGTFWLRVGQVALGIIALALGVTLIGKQYVPSAIVGKAFLGRK